MFTCEKPISNQNQFKRNGRLVEGFTLGDWVASSYEELYIIKMSQVVTITELDPRILISERHLSREESDVSTDKISREMGYLGSVSSQKKKLEDLFNKASMSLEP